MKNDYETMIWRLEHALWWAQKGDFFEDQMGSIRDSIKWSEHYRKRAEEGK